MHSLPFTIRRAKEAAVQNEQGLAYRVVEEVRALRLPATHAVSLHTARGDSAVQWHAAAEGSAVELAGAGDPTAWTIPRHYGPSHLGC